MQAFLKVAQYFGFVTTQISNFLLLYLIITKASPSFGSYKYLMASYSVYSLLYAWIEIATLPIIHTYKASMFFYCDSFLKYYKTISTPLCVLYCASFAFCISLLSTHFIYRFLAVCRRNDLHKFEGLKLWKLFIFPFVVSIVWYTNVMIFLGPSNVKSEYNRAQIREVYQDDTYAVGYVSFLYYYYDKQSERWIICWKDIFGAFIVYLIMTSCIVVMVVCGWKTFKKMKNIGKMSKRTKELNKQLFKTLILQTLVPVCTMFMPVGTLFFIPLLSISFGKFSNMPSLYAAVYPALDACIAIFMIRDFRNTVLCRGKTSKSVVSATTTSVVNPDTSFMSS